MKISVAGIITILILLFFFCSTTSIKSGHVGVLTSFGKIQEETLRPGLNFKAFWKTCHKMDCKIKKEDIRTDCFSKDLQLVEFTTTLNYRLVEANAPKVFAEIGKDYLKQVTPRVEEVMKQEIARYNAEEIISKRDEIRRNIIAIISARVKSIVDVVDVVITDIGFSATYEKAIENKQVAQQEALKAKYELEKAKVESEKLITLAQGEAEAIAIRGRSIKNNPGVIQLEAINKWNGVAPTTVVLGAGTNDVPVVFPIK